MKKKLIFASLIALIIAVLAIAGLWIGLKMYIETPLPAGGDFTLQSVNGPRSLKSFAGKEVVLYFGYTSCPDACPTSLSHLAEVFGKLSADQRAQIVPVFISVDSRADTPQKADDYAKFFFKNDGVGLTGTKTAIDQVVKQYGTSYSFVEDKTSALGYTVEHGNDFYFIDRKGRLRAIAPTLASDQQLLDDLKSLL